MYPPSNNNCNYNPNFSSLFHNIPSPYNQYEHEIFFEHYHDYYLQEQQIPFSEYTSIDILDESSETAKSQLNCTDSVKVLCDKEIVAINHGPSENEGEEGRENKVGEMSSTTSNLQRISRNKTNRSSNKDRHSKINTAQGPRDRRMRLSLDAARKFFNLQDMLQFDKPSKTIDWLLIKSEYAIKELTKGIGGALDPKQSFTSTGNIGAISTNASSNISECESKVVDNLAIASDEFSSNDKMPEGSSSIKEKKKAKVARRATFHTFTRESRNLARANARERTKRKKSLEDLCAQVQHSNMVNHSLYEVEEINRADESNLVVNGNWNPFGIFNFQQNAGISHENQFTDLQFCGKL